MMAGSTEDKLALLRVMLVPFISATERLAWPKGLSFEVGRSLQEETPKKI